MSRALYTNVASATLLSALSSAATTLTLNAGQGSLFPTPTNGDYSWITITDAATGNNIEIIQCTGRVGDVLTITRGQQSTSPQNWLINDKVELRVTATGMMETMLAGQHGSQLFTSSGSFLCPSGVTSVNVTVVGGSGGGSGGGYLTGGAGGGAGAFGKSFAVAVTPFSLYTVVVGVGGSGGAGGNYSVIPGSGSPGATSSFTASVVISASGGFGGANSSPGAGGRTINNCSLLQYGLSGSGSAGAQGVYYTGGTSGTNTFPQQTAAGLGYAGGGGGSNSSSSPIYGGVGGAGSAGYVLIEW